MNGKGKGFLEKIGDWFSGNTSQPAANSAGSGGISVLQHGGNNPFASNGRMTITDNNQREHSAGSTGSAGAGAYVMVPNTAPIDATLFNNPDLPPPSRRSPSQSANNRRDEKRPLVVGTAAGGYGGLDSPTAAGNTTRGASLVDTKVNNHSVIINSHGAANFDATDSGDDEPETNDDPDADPSDADDDKKADAVDAKNTQPRKLTRAPSELGRQLGRKETHWSDIAGYLGRSSATNLTIGLTAAAATSSAVDLKADVKVDIKADIKIDEKLTAPVLTATTTAAAAAAAATTTAAAAGTISKQIHAALQRIYPNATRITIGEISDKQKSHYGYFTIDCEVTTTNAADGRNQQPVRVRIFPRGANKLTGDGFYNQLNQAAYADLKTEDFIENAATIFHAAKKCFAECAQHAIANSEHNDALDAKNYELEFDHWLHARTIMLIRHLRQHCSIDPRKMQYDLTIPDDKQAGNFRATNDNTSDTSRERDRHYKPINKLANGLLARYIKDISKSTLLVLHDHKKDGPRKELEDQLERWENRVTWELGRPTFLNIFSLTSSHNKTAWFFNAQVPQSHPMPTSTIRSAIDETDHKDNKDGIDDKKADKNERSGKKIPLPNFRADIFGCFDEDQKGNVAAQTLLGDHNNRYGHTSYPTIDEKDHAIRLFFAAENIEEQLRKEVSNNDSLRINGEHPVTLRHIDVGLISPVQNDRKQLGVKILGANSEEWMVEQTRLAHGMVGATDPKIIFNDDKSNVQLKVCYFNRGVNASGERGVIPESTLCVGNRSSRDTISPIEDDINHRGAHELFSSVEADLNTLLTDAKEPRNKPFDDLTRVFKETITSNLAYEKDDTQSKISKLNNPKILALKLKLRCLLMRHALRQQKLGDAESVTAYKTKYLNLRAQLNKLIPTIVEEKAGVEAAPAASWKNCWHTPAYQPLADNAAAKPSPYAVPDTLDAQQTAEETADEVRYQIVVKQKIEMKMPRAIVACINEINKAERTDNTIYKELYNHRRIAWEELSNLAPIHDGTGHAKGNWGNAALETLLDQTHTQYYTLTAKQVVITELLQLYYDVQKAFYNRTNRDSDQGEENHFNYAYHFQARIFVLSNLLSQVMRVEDPTRRQSFLEALAAYCKSGKDRTGRLFNLTLECAAFFRLEGYFPRLDNPEDINIMHMCGYTHLIHLFSAGHANTNANTPGATGFKLEGAKRVAALASLGKSDKYAADIIKNKYPKHSKTNKASKKLYNHRQRITVSPAAIRARVQRACNLLSVTDQNTLAFWHRLSDTTLAALNAAVNQPNVNTASRLITALREDSEVAARQKRLVTPNNHFANDLAQVLVDTYNRLLTQLRPVATIASASVSAAAAASEQQPLSFEQISQALIANQTLGERSELGTFSQTMFDHISTDLSPLTPAVPAPIPTEDSTSCWPSCGSSRNNYEAVQDHSPNTRNRNGSSDTVIHISGSGSSGGGGAVEMDNAIGEQKRSPGKPRLSTMRRDEDGCWETTKYKLKSARNSCGEYTYACCGMVASCCGDCCGWFCQSVPGKNAAEKSSNFTKSFLQSGAYLPVPAHISKPKPPLVLGEWCGFNEDSYCVRQTDRILVSTASCIFWGVVTFCALSKAEDMFGPPETGDIGTLPQPAQPPSVFQRPDNTTLADVSVSRPPPNEREAFDVWYGTTSSLHDVSQSQATVITQQNLIINAITSVIGVLQSAIKEIALLSFKTKVAIAAVQAIRAFNATYALRCQSAEELLAELLLLRERAKNRPSVVVNDNSNQLMLMLQNMQAALTDAQQRLQELEDDHQVLPGDIEPGQRYLAHVFKADEKDAPAVIVNDTAANAANNGVRRRRPPLGLRNATKTNLRPLTERVDELHDMHTETPLPNNATGARAMNHVSATVPVDLSINRTIIRLQTAPAPVVNNITNNPVYNDGDIRAEIKEVKDQVTALKDIHEFASGDGPTEAGRGTAVHIFTAEAKGANAKIVSVKTASLVERTDLAPITSSITNINNRLDGNNATLDKLDKMHKFKDGQMPTDANGNAVHVYETLQSASVDAKAIPTITAVAVAPKPYDDKELRDRVTTNERDISTLQTEVKTINDRITIINERVTALNTRVETFEKALAELTARVVTAERNIETINKQISDIRTEIAAIKSEIDGIKSRLTKVEGDIITINQTITALTAKVAELEKRVDELDLMHTLRPIGSTVTETFNHVSINDEKDSKKYDTAASAATVRPINGKIRLETATPVVVTPPTIPTPPTQPVPPTPPTPPVPPTTPSDPTPISEMVNVDTTEKDSYLHSNGDVIRHDGRTTSRIQSAQQKSDDAKPAKSIAAILKEAVDRCSFQILNKAMRGGLMSINLEDVPGRAFFSFEFEKTAGSASAKAKCKLIKATCHIFDTKRRVELETQLGTIKLKSGGDNISLAITPQVCNDQKDLTTKFSNTEKSEAHRLKPFLTTATRDTKHNTDIKLAPENLTGTLKATSMETFKEVDVPVDHSLSYSVALGALLPHIHDEAYFNFTCTQLFGNAISSAQQSELRTQLKTYKGTPEFFSSSDSILRKLIAGEDTSTATVVSSDSKSVATPIKLRDIQTHANTLQMRIDLFTETANGFEHRTIGENTRGTIYLVSTSTANTASAATTQATHYKYLIKPAVLANLSITPTAAPAETKASATKSSVASSTSTVAAAAAASITALLNPSASGTRTPPNRSPQPALRRVNDFDGSAGNTAAADNTATAAQTTAASTSSTASSVSTYTAGPS